MFPKPIQSLVLEVTADETFLTMPQKVALFSAWRIIQQSKEIHARNISIK